VTFVDRQPTWCSNAATAIQDADQYKKMLYNPKAFVNNLGLKFDATRHSLKCFHLFKPIVTTTLLEETSISNFLGILLQICRLGPLALEDALGMGKCWFYNWFHVPFICDMHV
jgi:hypothetical protein